MVDDWQMIADIRAGARVVKSKGETYLPRYQNERVKEFKKRLESTPWRPEFVDALRNLCSKPFTKAVALQGTVSDRIKEIAEDIDGEGHDLHSFARDTFINGVAAGVVGIYVTYPDVEPAKTQAEEDASGVRPYWVPLDATNIIALYTKKINGRDVVQDIRLKECEVVPDGFDDVTKHRIRHIYLDATGAPVWTLYEKHQDAVTKEVKWDVVGAGALTLPEIPIVLFFTGERSGTYQVKPPLLDLAVMQLEIYRALSREDEILTYAGSPMLKAVGMDPPQPTSAPQIVDGRERLVESPAVEITVGPKTILWARPSENPTDWDFIQPNAANIKAVQDSVDGKITHFRRLAMQPQTHMSGNLTATSAAIDAAKAHSAIEVWANALKDVLEQAFVYTAMWLKEAETVEVSVHTDFGLDSEGTDEAANLIKMRQSGDLSQDTLWQELQRRGILGPQFDADKEKEQIASDQVGLVPEQEIDPVTGQPIANQNQTQAA